MNTIEYKIARIGVNNSSDAIKGDDIFYQCGICNSIIPSKPNDNVHRSRGNVGIVHDMVGLFFLHKENFIILRKHNIDY